MDFVNIRPASNGWFVAEWKNIITWGKSPESAFYKLQGIIEPSQEGGN